MPDTRRQDLRSEAALLLVVLVWGFNFPIVKAVLQIMHPHVLNALRFVISALVLGALYVYRRRRRGQSLLQPLRDHPLQLAGLGMLGFVLYQFSFIIGLDYTTAGNAALIMASSPIWTAVVGAAFRFERLRGASWLALCIVLLGTLVVVIGGAGEIHFGSGAFVGNLVMLLAAIFWGAYTAFSKPALRSLSVTGLTFLSLLFALPFLFGISAPYFAEVDWSRVTILHWGALVYSGGLSTGLAIAVWNNSVDRVGASNTAVFGNLVPLVALLSSFLLLGETVLPGQIAGGTLVVGGVLLMRRARRPAIESSELTRG